MPKGEGDQEDSEDEQPGEEEKTLGFKHMDTEWNAWEFKMQAHQKIHINDMPSQLVDMQVRVEQQHAIVATSIGLFGLILWFMWVGKEE